MRGPRSSSISILVQHEHFQRQQRDTEENRTEPFKGSATPLVERFAEEWDRRPTDEIPSNVHLGEE